MARVSACVLVAAMAAIAVCEAQPQTSTLDVVLDRLSAYLLDYESKVSELAAEEEYDQWIKRRPGYGQEVVSKRRIKSTFFLVRLPDGQAWYGFRDVTSVDGRVKPTAQRSMAQLLNERTVDAYAEALEITRENAKYNIGVFRTINLPLQVLELLHPRHRSRFRFRAAERRRVGGRDALIVEFNERTLPSLVSDGFDGDRLSHGRVWVEPGTGAVLRTELGFDGPAGITPLDNLIRVTYQNDSRLGLLLPAEMEETYGLDIEVVHARAKYRNYRRFETGARLVPQPE
jgi:hypothetical protein